MYTGNTDATVEKKLKSSVVDDDDDDVDDDVVVKTMQVYLPINLEH